MRTKIWSISLLSLSSLFIVNVLICSKDCCKERATLICVSPSYQSCYVTLINSSCQGAFVVSFFQRDSFSQRAKCFQTDWRLRGPEWARPGTYNKDARKGIRSLSFCEKIKPAVRPLLAVWPLQMCCVESFCYYCHEIILLLSLGHTPTRSRWHASLLTALVCVPFYYYILRRQAALSLAGAAKSIRIAPERTFQCLERFVIVF